MIEPFPTCIGDAPVGTATDVQTKLKIAELHQAGLDGSNVAVAIMDTGFNTDFLSQTYPHVRFDAGNSWANPATPGLVPGDQKYGQSERMSHGSMCAWNVLSMAPKVSLLDYPILAGAPPAGAAIGATVMSAYSGLSHLAQNWVIGFGPGQVGTKYKALVINNSWGMYRQSWDFAPDHPGRYSDNPNHIYNRLLASLVANGADIVFAAGNCGADCPDGRCQGTTGTICGGNAMEDVLTLAGCDTADARVGYSSQGPSIQGMFQKKPDIAAYTHFKGSEAYGTGTEDSGTSTACPLAVGCVAALRTALTPNSEPPSSMIKQLQQTATRAPGTGWNPDLGYGIINPKKAARRFGILPDIT